MSVQILMSGMIESEIRGTEHSKYIVNDIDFLMKIVFFRIL